MHKIHHCSLIFIGAIDMSGNKKIGQDVRFHSNLVWLWYPSMNHPDRITEYLNSSIGLPYESTNTNSSISTLSFLKFYFKELLPKFIPHDDILSNNLEDEFNLEQLCKLKYRISPSYENAKHYLLTKHCVFKYWSRRRYRINN